MRSEKQTEHHWFMMYSTVIRCLSFSLSFSALQLSVHDASTHLEAAIGLKPCTKRKRGVHQKETNTGLILVCRPVTQTVIACALV